MRHKGKQRRDTSEQNFEDKTSKVLRSQNNKIAHKKTKNKNKINKKKGWQKINREKTKKGIIEQVYKNETFEGEKNKIDDREEQKTSQKHKGKKWTRKQFEKEKKKTQKTQKTHSKRSQEDLVKKNTKNT